MTQKFDSVAGVLGAVGRDLGVTGWMTLSQQRINLFADATDDHQWIHVDEARASAGPFGGCIAHGYLTLGLASKFLPELVAYDGLTMGVNYGCERVRFPAPVRAAGAPWPGRPGRSAPWSSGCCTRTRPSGRAWRRCARGWNRRARPGPTPIRPGGAAAREGSSARASARRAGAP